MTLFDADQANQGSPAWWDLRRGIPTSSRFDSILTPKRMEYSKGAEAYMHELARDVASESRDDAPWWTEAMNKPPNHAIKEGIKREAESRNWLAWERDCDVLQVGFCLHANGLWGCSPDGILVGDAGTFESSLELKNPQGDTQVKYLLSGELPPEYRCQVHGHLLVTGLPRCWFLSYHPDLDKLLIEVRPDEFTVRLKEALETFTKNYLAVLDKLKLRGRFEQQRSNTLSHFAPAEVA